jgi:cobalt-precorrin 5A hydrolase/precorrin-3B C17-methyltransferase
VAALGFAPAAEPVLRLLEQAGLSTETLWPPGHNASGWLAERWPSLGGVVAVGAAGIVTRLVAPLLTDKHHDPAVLVIDAAGHFVVPLLGGHGAGGERLGRQIAGLLGGQLVLTGSSGSRGRLALDAFGSEWGWHRGSGDWNALMATAAADIPLTVRQEGGLDGWRDLEAAPPLRDGGEEADLVIGPRLGPGCRWHPPCLWLGLGCERDTSPSLVERLVDQSLRSHGLAAAAVAGLASITLKSDETALLELARRRGWPLRFFPAAALAEVAVPHPSARVEQEVGTASVAEAAAILAATAAESNDAGAPASAPLLLPKTVGRPQGDERGAATLAVALARRQWAPQRGALHLVGSGPGRLDLLTMDARRALAEATVWVGYGSYLDLLEPLRHPGQLRREGRLTEERDRCAEALALARAGVKVALISSGDSGIYGMAGLALELWLDLEAVERPPFEVHPGVSAVQLAAARVGAPLMHDFCTISLSDRLTPWPVIERRLRAAAAGDFVVALYNPRSQGRDWQLERARRILLEERQPHTPVVVARQLGREGEQVRLHSLATLPVDSVDMLTLVVVGNSSSIRRDGRMVTPRGYAGREAGEGVKSG